MQRSDASSPPRTRMGELTDCVQRGNDGHLKRKHVDANGHIVAISRPGATLPMLEGVLATLGRSPGGVRQWRALYRFLHPEVAEEDIPSPCKPRLRVYRIDCTGCADDVADLNEDVPRYMPEQINQLVQFNRAFASANSSLQHDNAALRRDNLDLQGRLAVQQQELERLRTVSGSRPGASGQTLSTSPTSAFVPAGSPRWLTSSPPASFSEGPIQAQVTGDAAASMATPHDWPPRVAGQGLDLGGAPLQGPQAALSRASRPIAGHDACDRTRVSMGSLHDCSPARLGDEGTHAHHATPSVTAPASSATAESEAPPTAETSNTSLSDSAAASARRDPMDETVRPADLLLRHTPDRDDILRAMDECVTGITGAGMYP